MPPPAEAAQDNGGGEGLEDEEGSEDGEKTEDDEAELDMSCLTLSWFYKVD